MVSTTSSSLLLSDITSETLYMNKAENKCGKMAVFLIKHDAVMVTHISSYKTIVLMFITKRSKYDAKFELKTYQVNHQDT